jgi:hypothetical protein
MEAFKVGDRVRLNAVSARQCAPAHRDRLGIVTAVTTMIYVRWAGDKTDGPLHPMFLEVVPSEEALAAEKLRVIGELEYASWSAMREEANPAPLSERAILVAARALIEQPKPGHRGNTRGIRKATVCP